MDWRRPRPRCREAVMESLRSGRARGLVIEVCHCASLEEGMVAEVIVTEDLQGNDGVAG